jgi:hypothetical protein
MRLQPFQKTLSSPTSPPVSTLTSVGVGQCQICPACQIYLAVGSVRASTFLEHPKTSKILGVECSAGHGEHNGDGACNFLSHFSPLFPIFPSVSAAPPAFASSVVPALNNNQSLCLAYIRSQVQIPWVPEPLSHLLPCHNPTRISEVSDRRLAADKV